MDDAAFIYVKHRVREGTAGESAYCLAYLGIQSSENNVTRQKLSDVEEVHSYA